MKAKTITVMTVFIFLFSHDLLVVTDDDDFESLDVPSLQDEDEGRSFIPIERRRFHQVTPRNHSVWYSLVEGISFCYI